MKAARLLWLSSLLMVASTQQAAALTVRPSSSQFFIGDSVALSWDSGTPSKLRRNNSNGRVSQCGDGWGEPANSSCTVELLMPWDSGVYWSESRDGATSERINITVTDQQVLLQGPVLPVTEGQEVSLSCKTKKARSNHTAAFYRGPALLGTRSSGIITLPGVSRSQEGFYSCSIHGARSPPSWISITEWAPPTTTAPLSSEAPPSGPAPLMLTVRVLCHLLVFCPYCISTLLMVSVYRGRTSDECSSSG